MNAGVHTRPRPQSDRMAVHWLQIKKGSHQRLADVRGEADPSDDVSFILALVGG